MKTLSFLALSILSTHLLAGGFGGGTFDITQVVEYTEEVVVPGYDATNGPITGALLCVRFRQDRDLQGESLSNLPSTVEAEFTEGELFLEIGDNVIWAHEFDDESNEFAPAAFDGTADLTGTSSFSWHTVQGGFKTVSITDPDVLAHFVSDGPVTLQLSGLGIFSKSGPGSLFTDVETLIRAAGRIAYSNN